LKIEPSASALGTFDGLHIGHRVLLEEVRKKAKEKNLRSLVFTFPLPPQNYLGRPKKLILPPKKKLCWLRKEVDQVVVADFSDVCWMSPQKFVQDVLIDKLRAEVVVVGVNYRFGRDRKGDVDLLRELGRKHGFEVEVIPPVTLQGEVVSSTAIRRAIRRGDVEHAASLLGYLPVICGTVIRGEGRGKELGFPTANLEVDEELITPKEGVFASFVHLEGQMKEGLLYIGYKPTFNGRQKSFEVYVLSLSENLYGEEIEVRIIKKLRGDKRFPNPGLLKEQIKSDIKNARTLFQNLKSSPIS
jgi:riboflavin kinase/FMN adenylyltransferase